MFIDLSFACSWKHRLITSLIMGSLLSLGLASPAQADDVLVELSSPVAIVPIFSPPPTATLVPLPSATDMTTQWGYGPAENAYNDLIVESIDQYWPDKEHPIDPLLFKALIANESSFRKDVFSRSGCAGLVQLAPDTAKRFGLSLSPIDERLIPEKAIPVGLKVLAEKQRVILEPSNYYGIVLGRPDKACPFGTVVAQDFATRGTPDGQALLMLELASYNGGGGTVMRAMAIAVQTGKNPHSWDEIVGSTPDNSPLYQACQMIYKGGASGKYREMANYPRKILALSQKQ